MPGSARTAGLLLRVAPALLYMAWIFYLSSIPNPLPAPLPDGMDKVAHFGTYGLLGILLARALYAQPQQRLFRAWLACSLIAAAYGISDEFHQYFTPGRSAEVLDAAADGLGGAAGAWAWLAVARKYPGIMKYRSRKTPQAPSGAPEKEPAGGPKQA